MSSGSILIVNASREAHGGDWVCRVENQLGAEEVTVRLVVYGSDYLSN